MLLDFAMVAQGEIGLVVVQTRLNNTPYLSKDTFIAAVWANVLATSLGLVPTGFIVKYEVQSIANGLSQLDKAEESYSNWDGGISRTNTTVGM